MDLTSSDEELEFYDAPETQMPSPIKSTHDVIQQPASSDESGALSPPTNDDQSGGGSTGLGWKPTQLTTLQETSPERSFTMPPTKNALPLATQPLKRTSAEMVLVMSYRCRNIARNDHPRRLGYRRKSAH